MIKSIELRNITSHEFTHINFQKGINLLIGNNGCGKSSIVNMIGYILFDYIPGKQGSYVRHSSKSKNTWGSVRIEIITDDNIEYSIYRTIGKKPNVIQVKELHSGFVLEDIQSKTDLKYWIKEVLEIKPGYDLETIFKSAIGVPQGLVTAPFKETSPGKRRQYFNEILHVDIYNKIYEESRKIKKIFNERNQKIEVEIGKKESKVKEIPEFSKEREKLTEISKKLKKSNQNAVNEAKIVKKIVDKFEETDKKIGEIKHNKQLSEQKRDNLLKNLVILRIELNESKKAKEICDKNFKDYSKFLSLSKQLPDLENKQDDMSKITEELNLLEQKSGEYSIKIEHKTEELNKIIEESKNIDSLREQSKINTALSKEIENLKEKNVEIKNYEKNLENQKKKYKILLDNLKKSEDSLKELPQIQLKKKESENLEEKYKKVEKQVNSNNAKIQQLEIDKERSKDGNCPILDEKCLNIGEKSLSSYFDNRIEELASKQNPLQQQLITIKRDLDKLGKIQVDLEKLMKIQVKFEGFSNQINELEGEMKAVSDQILPKNQIQKKLSDLSEKQKIINDQVKNLDRIERNIEEVMPKVKNEITGLTRYKQKNTEIIEKLKLKKSELTEYIKNLKEIQKELKTVKKSHDIYLVNKNSMDKLEERDGRFQKASNTVEILSKKITKQQNDLQNLIGKFDLKLYEENKTKRDELSDLIAASSKELEMTNERLKEINEKLKKLEKIKKEYQNLQHEHKKILDLIDFIETIRIWFKEAGPKITKILLKNINLTASEIYRDLMDVKTSQLVWSDDFEVAIHLPGGITNFSGLSGGEQMSAALAVRLAILKIMTSVNFAFFDEPTSNLDPDKRSNLSKCLQNIKGFDQLYVISHDDTFEENAENVIQFEKEEGLPSVVTQLTD